MSFQKTRSTKSLLDDFPVFTKLTVSSFMEVWDHYDEDDNGYIEGKELDKFFKDLITKLEGTEPTTDRLTGMKAELMAKYDKAGDGRISLEEMSAILPTDENFLLLFRRDQNLTSSVDLMEIWRKYDMDKTGFINQTELAKFIHDWILKSNPDAELNDEKLQEYMEPLLLNFVKDQKLGVHDMARLLNTRSNLLLEFEEAVKGKTKTEVLHEFNRLFNYYDKSSTGFLDGTELDAFVKDFFELTGNKIGAPDIDRYKAGLLQHCNVDLDHNGRIDKKELAMVLINAPK